MMADKKYCELCGNTFLLQNHHIFFSSLRKKSDKYNECQITLCWNCHLSEKGVHQNKELNLKVKRMAQNRMEEIYGREWFLKEFYKNYLDF